MSTSLSALREAAELGLPPSGNSGVWISDPSAAQAACSFASLIDLARMQFGASQVEVCDACNTVNLGSTRQCKGCAHKLPAYYAACEEDAKLPRLAEATLKLHWKWLLADRASLADFAAFTLVVNLVVIVAEFMPVQ